MASTRKGSVVKRKRAPKAISSGTIFPGLWPSMGSWSTSLFNNGWLQEPFTGAWQRNISTPGDRASSPLAFSAVNCCVTGIASDIGKLRPKLMREDSEGIWTEIQASPFAPVLDTPNSYQNRIQFLESWILSKLLYGNTYIGLERDDRGSPGAGVVRTMHVLDPMRVRPLITSDGTVYYQLYPDRLPNIQEEIIVPASEIIHDRMEALWHPLIGVSPLYACAATVGLGNSIQSNSQTFFANASQPGGMLTAPGRISDDTAARLKTTFEERFSGVNIGRLFVAGDGLEFKPFALTAEASQLVDQLKWSVEDVARAFHYPAYKLDSTKVPPYSGNNIRETLALQYLSDCLQKHIESIELLLERGLSLPSGQHVELDTDILTRMDTAAMYTAITEGIQGGWLAPNEGRNRANLRKVSGGDTPYMQQQNFPLAALASQTPQASAQAAARALEDFAFSEMQEAMLA